MSRAVTSRVRRAVSPTNRALISLSLSLCSLWVCASVVYGSGLVVDCSDRSDRAGGEKLGFGLDGVRQLLLQLGEACRRREQRQLACSVEDLPEVASRSSW